MNYQLSNTGISEALSELDSFLEISKIKKNDSRRVCLGVEEVLIRFREQFGEDTEFTIKCGKSLGTAKISVSVKGQMFDPLANRGAEDGTENIMRHALTSMGEMPVWNYYGGTNYITYSVEKFVIPSWGNIVIALVAAVVLGLILKQCPADVVEFVSVKLFTPLLNTIVNTINAISVPMIFIAIIWGIYSVGDASTFNVIGRKLFGHFMIHLCVATAVVGLIMIPCFNLGSGGVQSLSEIDSLLQMVLDIVPGNAIKPFYDGNTLQVLFIGIVIGLVMLKMNEKTKMIASLTEQLDLIVQSIMKMISKLVPFFVFGSVLNLILTNDISVVAEIYKPLLLVLASFALLLLAETVIVCLKMKLSPIVLWRKASETFIIALTTASSAAAFSSNLKMCEEKYGINPSLANFGVSFGQIVYKPSASIMFIAVALYIAEIAGIKISFLWVAMAIFVSIILSVATPSIPGGMLASLSVLFLQLGLPMETMGVVITICTLMDFFATATYVISVGFVVILAADEFSMLDKDRLRSPLIEEE